MKVLTTEQMRQIEERCVKMGLPTSQLMENAGRAVAEKIRGIVSAIDQQHILVLVGPGNNGGDGLVAARYLHDWGANVILYIFGPRLTDDPNLKMVQEREITCVEANQNERLDSLSELLPTVNVVVDALFGTGKTRPIDGIFQKALERVTEAKNKRPSLRIIALDLPSGLNADTGAVDPACLFADNTVTLGFPKVGLFNSPGAERAGVMTVADIGIPAYLADPIQIELITSDWARSVLPRRPLIANKGSFGRVLAVTGSINYIGAAYLACSGALRVGAGLVTLAIADSLQPILASKLTEVTYIPLPESQPGIISSQAAKLINRERNSYNVLLVGCGLGQSRSVMNFIKAIILKSQETTTSLVVDADALNTLAKTSDWWQQLTDDAILTPHPGEMSRLVGTSIDEVQSNRIGIVQGMAQEWQKTIVLKGAYSVVATPDGQCKISSIANPGLASAGTGDVLTGTIAGLLAQGLTPLEAAACGVYLHGEAGETVKAEMGNAGMIAGDLLPALPLVIKQLKEEPIN